MRICFDTQNVDDVQYVRSILDCMDQKEEARKCGLIEEAKEIEEEIVDKVMAVFPSPISSHNIDTS